MGIAITPADCRGSCAARPAPTYTPIRRWRSPDIASASGPIPRRTDFKDTGGPFFLDRAGTRPDPLNDDLALWLRAPAGLVVCVGCAHAGLVNTLEHVRCLNAGERLHVVIGGFHLGGASPERLRRTVAALREMEVERVVPCHCTGEAATAGLRDALGARLTPGVAGLSFRF
ncbi:MAG TPA: MBL fold metallo-hydrolase [Candidatus Aminicenantes bacterium]|nr:MBL fold metallo-hydrolase [Candidatus Aminicenantes bacterium]